MDKVGKSIVHTGKIAFKLEELPTNEGIAPQSRDILRTFVWWVACEQQTHFRSSTGYMVGGGGGQEIAPHHTIVCKISQLRGVLLA